MPEIKTPGIRWRGRPVLSILRDGKPFPPEFLEAIKKLVEAWKGELK